MKKEERRAATKIRAMKKANRKVRFSCVFSF